MSRVKRLCVRTSAVALELSRIVMTASVSSAARQVRERSSRRAEPA